MWQDGQDTNEEGTPVHLYQPILYSTTRRAAESADPTCSYVGGCASYFASDDIVNVETPQCSACQQDMYLLLQLYNPEKVRTLYIFGCNGGSCVASLFEGESTAFSLGGGGRFVCRHSQPCKTLDTSADNNKIANSSNKPATAESPWGSDEKCDVDNDWDMSDGDDDNIESVEALVAAMEMKGPKSKVEKAKPSGSVVGTKNSPETAPDSPPSFTCFEIHSMQEPAGRISDDMDEDDVGMMGGINDDKKIQQMLARYLEEEEDQEIVAAIRGSVRNGGARGEKDERLPPEDRAMLAFTDRVKRSPRQIVRYAQGGIPLWSIALPKEIVKETKQSGHTGRNDIVSNEQKVALFSVPNCPCGAEREFECQLMPNLLGVLDVDTHARRKENKSFSQLKIDELMSREHGGMNWGAIAIYTCKDDCDVCREDFVIVQDSTDGNPEMKVGITIDSVVVDADGEEEARYDDFDDNCDDDFGDD